MIWKECALWCESYFPLRFYKSHFPTLIRKTLMTNVTKNKKRMSIMKLKKSCIKSLATFQFQLALMIKHVLFFGVGPTQGWNYYKIWYDCVCENSENHFQEGIVPKKRLFCFEARFWKYLLLPSLTLSTHTPNRWCSTQRSITNCADQSLARLGTRLTRTYWGIENLKHNKMLDPLGQAWQNGSALAMQL